MRARVSLNTKGIRHQMTTMANKADELSGHLHEVSAALSRIQENANIVFSAQICAYREMIDVLTAFIHDSSPTDFKSLLIINSAVTRIEHAVSQIEDVWEKLSKTSNGMKGTSPFSSYPLSVFQAADIKAIYNKPIVLEETIEEGISYNEKTNTFRFDPAFFPKDLSVRATTHYKTRVALYKEFPDHIGIDFDQHDPLFREKGALLAFAYNRSDVAVMQALKYMASNVSDLANDNLTKELLPLTLQHVGFVPVFNATGVSIGQVGSKILNFNIAILPRALTVMMCEFYFVLQLKDLFLQPEQQEMDWMKHCVSELNKNDIFLVEAMKVVTEFFTGLGEYFDQCLIENTPTKKVLLIPKKFRVKKETSPI